MLDPETIMEQEQRSLGQPCKLITANAIAYRENVAMLVVFQAESQPIGDMGTQYAIRWALHVEGPQPSRTAGIIETWFEREITLGKRPG